MGYSIPLKHLKLDVTDREKKLPKWAQEELSDLRRRLSIVSKMWVAAENRAKKKLPSVLL